MPKFQWHVINNRFAGLFHIILHSVTFDMDNNDLCKHLLKNSSSRQLRKRVFYELFASFREPNESERNLNPRHRIYRKRNDYWNFAWGKMLKTGLCGDESTREGKYFRRRFRVPFILYERLVQALRDSGHFHESHRSAPLEVCLLFWIYENVERIVVESTVCSSHSWSRRMLRQPIWWNRDKWGGLTRLFPWLL